MNIYRLLLCGQPIKRAEYLKRNAIIWTILIAATLLSLHLHRIGSESPFILNGILWGLILEILSIFWTYWRIRDCLEGRYKVAFALLATAIFYPVLIWVWLVLPSREIPPKIGPPDTETTTAAPQ